MDKFIDLFVAASSGVASISFIIQYCLLKNGNGLLGWILTIGAVILAMVSISHLNSFIKEK